LSRFVWATAVASTLGALIYYSIPAKQEPTWLSGGRKFAEDDAASIQSVLSSESIPVYTDREGRIGVRPSDWTRALAALTKKKAVPETLAEIEKDFQTPNIWESREQREERRHWGLERKLEVMIERLEDIVAADVTIHREVVRSGLRPETRLSAFVYVDAGAARSVGPRSIRSIQTLLVSNCAGLLPDAVSISDRDGKFYLVAGDPAAGRHSRTMARAEELRESILGRLLHIQGIDVVVQIDELAEPKEPIRPVEETLERSTPHASEPPVVPAATMVNRPVELPPDPPTAPVVLPEQREEIEVATKTATAAADTASGSKAKIWVQVPRSYYLRAFDENLPDRQPAPEDLLPYIARTETLIRNAVNVLIPSRELGELRVDTIPDAPLQPRVVAKGLPGSARFFDGLPGWVPGAAVGAAAGLAMVMAAGFGFLASRRPRLPERTTLRRGTLSVDPAETSITVPSDRVRELVRADPEAAAGVLRRWIGQESGGDRS
jgi:flagellar M-ring protein FliF